MADDKPSLGYTLALDVDGEKGSRVEVSDETGRVIAATTLPLSGRQLIAIPIPAREDRRNLRLQIVNPFSASMVFSVYTSLLRR